MGKEFIGYMHWLARVQTDFQNAAHTGCCGYPIPTQVRFEGIKMFDAGTEEDKKKMFRAMDNLLFSTLRKNQRRQKGV